MSSLPVMGHPSTSNALPDNAEGTTETAVANIFPAHFEIADVVDFDENRTKALFKKRNYKVCLSVGICRTS